MKTINTVNQNLPKSRITVFCGNFGSGKTEISLNMAIAFKQMGEDVTFVDLDIVNPYFRSSSREGLLKQHGIEVLMPTFALSTVDVPALPAQIQSIFVDQTKRVIIDVGGDDTGAAALGRYKPYFDLDDTSMLYVVNAFRPLSSTADAIMELMARIEAKGRLQPSGLVNNANMAWETQPEHLLHGDGVLKEVSRRKGIPIVLKCGTREVLSAADPSIAGEPFPIEILMRPEWMG